MLLMFHIVFALLTFAFMGVAVGGKYFYRNRNFGKLAQLSGLSFIGLFASGVGLVIVYKTSLTSACLAGLAYLAALVFMYFVYRQISVSSEK